MTVVGRATHVELLPLQDGVRGLAAQALHEPATAPLTTESILIVGQDAACEQAAQALVGAILRAQSYMAAPAGGHVVSYCSPDAVKRIEVVSAPGDLHRAGRIVSGKVVCCRRRASPWRASTNSDYEFWTYACTLELALEEIEAPSLESMSHVAVALGILPDSLEAMHEALRLVTATTISPPFAAVGLDDLSSRTALDDQGAQARPDLSSSGVLVLFDPRYRASGYQIYGYLSELRRQIGSLVPITVYIGRQYRGPALRRLRIRSFRGPARPIHRQGFVYFVRRLGQKLARWNNAVSSFSNVSAETSAALDLIARRDSYSDLVVFSDGVRFGLTCVHAAQVLKASGIRRAAVVVSSDLPVEQEERSAVARTGARLLFDGTGLNRGLGLHGGSGRVLDLMDPTEAPLRHPCAPPVSWKQQLSLGTIRRNVSCILFVRPAWMKCGSATTFANLIRLFRARGAVIIDIALNPFRARYTDPDIDRQLREVEAEFNPWLHFTLSRGRWLSRWSVFVRMLITGAWPRTIAGIMALHYRRCRSPAWCRRVLRRMRVSTAYANHYFTMPYLQDAFRGGPIILDTHDIQSTNFTEQDYRSGWQRPRPFSECWAEEIEHMKPARKLLMVSEEELRLLKASLADADAEYFIPLPVFAAEGRAPGNSAPLIAPRMKTGCRLLIVASNNRANEDGVAWFLDRVWPQIRRADVTLDVVGSISARFADRRCEGATMHGIVPSLGERYEDADIVVLPITMGGGIAIKTLEAILLEKPVCATAHALRGLPESVRSVLPANPDDVAFVRDLAALCVSIEARRSRQALVREAKRLLLNEGFSWRFHRTLDEVAQT